MAKDETVKKLTIDDVAKLAGVSKTTVSRVINHKYGGMTLETRNKVLKVIEDSGYRSSNIARSLKNKSSRLIAFIVADLDTDFSSEMMQAMLEIVLDTRYHIIFWSSNNSVEQEKELIKSLLDQGVEAIILNPVSNKSSHLDDLRINVPLILINNQFLNSTHDIVKVDFLEIMNKGFTNVINNGYEEINLLVEDYHDKDNKELLANIFNKLINQYKSINSNLKGNVIYVDLSKPNIIDDTIKTIVSNNPTNAVVFASSGRILINSAISIKKLKNEKDFNLGLTGYDDLGVYKQYSWTLLSPETITRAVPNWHEMGLQIMLLVQERLSKIKGPKKIVEIASTYYEGESTKQIK